MNSISLVSVAELLDGRNFFIPAYQRGYRWTEAQMMDLLDDLYEFSIREKKTLGEFYCLQPIIVQRVISDSILQEIRDITGWGGNVTSSNTWEIIDGQQRLTSLYILYRYLISEEFISEKKLNRSGMQLYHLCYETRPESKDFLENLSSETQDCDDNIDFCFIGQAYKTIGTWLMKRGPIIARRYNRRATPDDILTALNNLLRTRREDTGEATGSAQFIWYELAATSKKNPIDEFVNINNGKIRLTDAELIKGLILQKRNFIGDKAAEQMKIALQWENIENTLHHNDFWHFLSATTNEDNRIELLFKLRYFESKGIDIKKEGLHDGDLFRFYMNDLLAEQPGPELKMAVEKEWENVLSIFNTLQEWYEDPVLYNIVGFLIHSGVNLEDIIAWDRSIDHNAPKQIFIDRLNEEIRKKLPSQEEVIARKIELEYGQTNVRHLLLFLNIYQLNKQIVELRKANPTFMTPAYKFPFDLYVSQHWDVEHIDSATQNDLRNIEEKEEWLRQSLHSLNIKIDDELNKYFENKEYEKIWSFVLERSHTSVSDESKKNQIGNLTLLDSKTNRSYKNAIFAYKRIEINKAITSGRFVPVCTQMVFNKSFKNQDVNLREWSDLDKDCYESFIVNELCSFYCITDKPMHSDLFNGNN